MRYKLILMPEAERHLQEWRKSGQKKNVKCLSLHKNKLWLN